MSPDTAVVESAIPTWLQKERTVPPVKGPDYKPAFELYTTRFPRETKDMVMAIIGAQYAPGVSNDGQAIDAIMAFTTKGEPECTPGFYETAAVTDQDDHYNVAVIMYWKSKAAHEKWAVTSGFHEWWNNLKSGQYHHGWFLEVFIPTIERLETVVTTEWPQGISHLRDEVSGPIREHVYWGSMRDRFPISQVDTLAGEPSPDNTRDSVKNKNIIPGRVRARGRKNLVVIRSGQDWAEAAPEEREMYINDMQPALTAGMDFLRDSGDEVGCFSCRFMSVVDPKKDFSETEATFGLAYFDSLESLENWSKSHKTHLRIFAEFSKYAKAMGEDMSLKLFHEVFVLEPEQQLFEYIDCHRQTGMLGTAKGA